MNIDMKSTNKKKECVELFRIPLPEIGMMADRIRQQKCGDLVTFVIDTNINYTNICISRCSFCAFYARDEGFVLPYEKILEKIAWAVDKGATQVMLQGGMNPELSIEWFEGLFTLIKSKFNSIHLHSLSPPEIVFLSKIENTSVKEVLDRLNKAGLDSLPGGGAEILVDEVRRKLSPLKCTSDEWINVMRSAHKLGMRSTATMMFGHIESKEDIIEHLLKIKKLQNETNGFTAFIPWTYQPGNNRLSEEVKERTPFTHYLRVLAISRIILDNIRNIQASWLTQGFDISVLSLFFGANDFGGVMLEESVLRSTGKDVTSPGVEKIVKAIKSVGRPAAQRDTYYRIIKRY